MHILPKILRQGLNALNITQRCQGFWKLLIYISENYTHSLSLSVYVCIVWLCVLFYVVSVYVCAHLHDMNSDLDVFRNYSTCCFLRQGLSLNPNLPIQHDCLASKLQDPPVSKPPPPGWCSKHALPWWASYTESVDSHSSPRSPEQALHCLSYLHSP